MCDTATVLVLSIYYLFNCLHQYEHFFDIYLELYSSDDKKLG